MWEQAKALQEGAEIVVCTPVSISLNDFSPSLGMEKMVSYWREFPLNCGKAWLEVL